MGETEKDTERETEGERKRLNEDRDLEDVGKKEQTKTERRKGRRGEENCIDIFRNNAL